MRRGAEGGRIPSGLHDGHVPVSVSTARSAERVDSHHAVITCGCGVQVPFERTDGEPLSAADIGNALVELDHDCAG